MLTCHCIRVVYCGQVFNNATYYEDMRNLSVRECVNECMAFDLCYSPVITPDGRCLLAELGRDENGDLDESFTEDHKGWAMLLPRFTGALSSPGFGSGISLSSTSSSSVSVLESGKTLQTPKDCQASSLTSKCPQCNNLLIEDSLGAMYWVFCGQKWVHRGTSKLLDFDLGRCMVSKGGLECLCQSFELSVAIAGPMREYPRMHRAINRLRQ